MIDPHKRGVGDDVQALLAAIVGVRAPADVGEEAGRGSKPLLFLAFLKAERAYRRLRPWDQLLAMRRGAGAEQIEFRLPASISGSALLVLAESLENSSPSRSPSAEIETGARIAHAQYLGKHDCAEWQKRLALPGNHRDARDLIQRAADQHFQEIVELVGIHPVFVHHMQRIAAVVHVKAGKRPPGPADRVEDPAVRVCR